MPSHVTVTREGWERPKKRIFPSVTVSSSGCCFLGYDQFQAVWGSFEVEDSYRLHGTLFFRQNEFDSSILCLVGTNGVVSDFNSLRLSSPIPLSKMNVHVSSGGEIVHVSFLPLDTAVLVSFDGGIGCVQFDRKSCLFTGQFNRYRKLCGVACCGVLPDSSLLVVLTKYGFCGVVDMCESVLLSLTRHGFFSELGSPCSCAPMPGVKTDTIDVVVTFSSSQSLHVFVASKLSHKGEHDHESDFARVLLESHLPSSHAYSYVKKCGMCLLVASVWQSLVRFSVCEGAKLRNVAVLENEMNVPYVSGCWVDDIFLVTRADGIALLFFVFLSEDESTGLRIVPLRHLDLSLCCSAFICGNSNYFLLLALGTLESLWSGTPGTICVTDSNNQRRFLKLCGRGVERSNTLLIDLTLFEGNIAVINVKRSGECYAIVSSGSKVEMLSVAQERNPEKVTC